VVGQRRDHGDAAALAVAIQVIDAGHADVGGGRLVHAGAGRADEREADRVAAEEDQAHGLLFHLDGETEHITQERGGGPQVGHLQIGSATQPLTHGCMLRAPAAPGGCLYRLPAAGRRSTRNTADEWVSAYGDNGAAAGKMAVVDCDHVAERARQRALVRRGYDAISLAYRSDDGDAAASSAESVSRYAGWMTELAGLLRPGARVVDLGCGAGIPATRELARQGLQVLGVDFSAVQLHRARRLVPAARFVTADIAGLHLRPASADAVVAFYSLIHVPLADQRALFPRIRDWLRPGGYLLAIVGARQWTGTAPYLGADMFWDHADTATYMRWLQAARLAPIWHRYIPEGSSGHTLVLAQAS
jgi:SAM-dependent methyltransferase